MHPSPRSVLRLALSATFLLLAAAAVPAASDFGYPFVESAGNDIYRVHINAGDPATTVPPAGTGLYTATTGPLHPAGEGNNVLYGTGGPGTSFDTIRSWTSQTDYCGDNWATSAFPVVDLSLYATVTALGTTGFRTTYTLPGPPETPDAMTITQEVSVRGTTFEDSCIDVVTTVRNDGTDLLDLGLRYLWDFQIGNGGYYEDGDDGPTFQPISPDGPVLLTEEQFILPAFDCYRIVDNDVNPAPPTFFILGTVNGPSLLNPTPPDLLLYTYWPTSSGTAFDYQVTPDLLAAADEAASTGTWAWGGDSAVLYYWGHDQPSSLPLLPGGSVTISASLFLTIPEVPVPFDLTPFDVKPGSEENPFNRNARGVLPAVLRGSAGFDVTQVDPATLRLAGVAPLRTSLEDVAEPLPPDGFTDLAMKFDAQALVAGIEALLGQRMVDGEVVEVTLTGFLKAEAGALPVTGKEKLRIIDKKKEAEKTAAAPLAPADKGKGTGRNH